jgi:DtxR family transcriptional regulator, manganese transport regulator
VSQLPAGARPPSPGLEAEDIQARGFGRVREAHAAELLEDYAELIDDLSRDSGHARATDIARRLGVSHVTAVKAVARLEREGFAISQPYRGVRLTPEGTALASRVRARHHLVLNLLLALGVPPDDARADAEGIEHHVSPATLAAFERFLKQRWK